MVVVVSPSSLLLSLPSLIHLPRCHEVRRPRSRPRPYRGRDRGARLSPSARVPESVPALTWPRLPLRATSRLSAAPLRAGCVVVPRPRTRCSRSPSRCACRMPIASASLWRPCRCPTHRRMGATGLLSACRPSRRPQSPQCALCGSGSTRIRSALSVLGGAEPARPRMKCCPQALSKHTCP